MKLFGKNIERQAVVAAVLGFAVGCGRKAGELVGPEPSKATSSPTPPQPSLEATDGGAEIEALLAHEEAHRELCRRRMKSALRQAENDTGCKAPDDTQVLAGAYCGYFDFDMCGHSFRYECKGGTDAGIVACSGGPDAHTSSTFIPR